MAIRSIRLQHFRSYDDRTFQLSSGVNLVVGPNGSGKTNLLEALYVMARGRSFRVGDSELLHYDDDWLRVDAMVDEHERTLTIQQTGAKVEKRLRIDGAVKARLSASERLRVVLFEPRDMQLLTGSPERRRDYLDGVLEQLELSYARTLAHYRRALSQRNFLLKQPSKPSSDQLFVWNVRLSELGAELIVKRRQLIDKITQAATAMYQGISGAKTEVQLNYVQQFSTTADDKLASVALHALERDYDKDRQRGFTSVGPHRDDVEVVLGGAPASTSASRGETRSLVVMLKLLEAELLGQRYAQRPLMLLDDVFGELDVQRRSALATHLKDHQVVITATDAEAMRVELSPKPKVIKLANT